MELTPTPTPAKQAREHKNQGSVREPRRERKHSVGQGRHQQCRLAPKSISPIAAQRDFPPEPLEEQC
jgi:hypothetical protein